MIKTQTARCTVTACDRDGRMLAQEVIEREFEFQVVEERAVVFKRFRREYPDCQIYFNWKGRE